MEFKGNREQSSPEYGVAYASKQFMDDIAPIYLLKMDTRLIRHGLYPARRQTNPPGSALILNQNVFLR
jgi:hypothetical protein